MSMTAHSVFIAKTNLNIEPQTIFTAVYDLGLNGYMTPLVMSKREHALITSKYSNDQATISAETKQNEKSVAYSSQR